MIAPFSVTYASVRHRTTYGTGHPCDSPRIHVLMTRAWWAVAWADVVRWTGCDGVAARGLNLSERRITSLSPSVIADLMAELGPA
jgi:hypothetical protein